jgi:hypothetical protein
LLNIKGLPALFIFTLVITPQKPCGPRFAQLICQFVTGSKRCSKEVEIKKVEDKSGGPLNRAIKKGF